MIIKKNRGEEEFAHLTSESKIRNTNTKRDFQ